MTRFRPKMICSARRIICLSFIFALSAVTDTSFAKDPGSKPVRLKAAQIRKMFQGHEFSDEVHWTKNFRKDGTIEGFSMGRKLGQRWSIQSDMLCIHTDKPDDCREVWKAGNSVELRRYSDDPVPTSGKIIR